MYIKFCKRIIDIFISSFMLIVLVPVFVIVSIIIFFKLGSSLIFRQQRPGLNGKPFILYKFRTMTGTCNPQGFLLPDSDRLTTIGLFLRSTSLDELPSLLNVLKGDMSLVGPRPLLMEYLPRYSKFQMHRHDVRPGITGWAQVNGRNALSWEEKFQLDVYYVDNMCLMLDLKIIILSIWKVLKCEGINQPGNATMEEFFGSINEN